VKDNPKLEAAFQQLAERVEASKSNGGGGGGGGAAAEPGPVGGGAGGAAVAPAAPVPAAKANAAPTTISELLVSIGLPQYVATFEEEEMELNVMADVMKRQGRAAMDEVLKDLGVASMGHRTKITNALA
jgi:hypothetical protein